MNIQTNKTGTGSRFYCVSADFKLKLFPYSAQRSYMIASGHILRELFQDSYWEEPRHVLDVNPALVGRE